MTIINLLNISFQVLSLIAIALLRGYQLEFAQGGLLVNGDDYRDRQMTGVIAVGSSLLISIPLLVGYIFFDCANNLLVSPATNLVLRSSNKTGISSSIEYNYYEKIIHAIEIVDQTSHIPIISKTKSIY